MKRSFVIVFMFFVLIPFNVKANIMCNDGSISSSCTDCHRGCCSKHGGCTSGGSPSSYSNSSSGSSSSSYAAVSSYVLGCTDPNAFNYNSSANKDDGSCISKKYGCTDASAINYDSSANLDDSSCLYKKEVKETKEIPFEKEYEETKELYSDDEKVKIEGKNGIKEITYEIILDKDGKETLKKIINEEITMEPVNEIVLKGTKNYSDDILPAAGAYGTIAIGTAIYTIKKKKL